MTRKICGVFAFILFAGIGGFVVGFQIGQSQSGISSGAADTSQYDQSFESSKGEVEGNESGGEGDDTERETLGLATAAKVVAADWQSKLDKLQGEWRYKSDSEEVIAVIEGDYMTIRTQGIWPEFDDAGLILNQGGRYIIGGYYVQLKRFESGILQVGDKTSLSVFRTHMDPLRPVEEVRMLRP